MRFLMLNWRDPENPLAGGAERVTQAYLAGLGARGHEAVQFSHAFPGCDPETVIDGVRIVRAGNTLTRFASLLSWYRKQPRFDLVIDQHHGVPWFAPWWCRTNCVAYIHEVLGPIWGTFYPWPLSWVGQIQERWTHRLYRKTRFWTGCESTKRQLAEHGIRDINVVSYGVETKALDSLPEKRLDGPIRIAMVSRLAPNKRVDHGLLALGVLRCSGVDASLTIMGDGETADELKRLASEQKLEPYCQFTGHISEEQKLRTLRDAHVLWHTSVREGWGLNVVEANAMGTPAVVYPVAGLVDSTRDGVTGLVTNAENPGNLAHETAALLTDADRYNLLRSNALEHARSMHWQNVLPRACDWLESIAVSKQSA